jgi:DNA-binding MarR family transcriptional regulator
MAGSQWLDDTEQLAWRSLLVLTYIGLPDLERTFRAHGLVHVEYGLLVQLSEQPQGLRLCDLAGNMNVSQSRLSHRMNKLLDRGLVEVAPSPEDGRVSIAHITPKGTELVERIAPQHVADVRRLIFDHLEPAQVTSLADALGAVAQGLRPGERLC